MSQIGEPVRTIQVEPVELPEPLRREEPIERPKRTENEPSLVPVAPQRD